MYNGDRARKNPSSSLVSASPPPTTTAPLNLKSFTDASPPSRLCLRHSRRVGKSRKPQGDVVQQIIRPTGLLDPIIEVRPATNQVDDVLEEIRKETEKGGRVLVTTLTKKLSEDLTKYLTEISVKAKYLHSDIDTLERVQIINDLRRGALDVLVGINLLREGLDIPEVSLVAILDADKEGFFRSETALIQTCGRASRNLARPRHHVCR